MRIHFNTPPVHSGIGAKCTNLAKLRVLAAALVVATAGLHSGLSQAAESARPPAMAPMLTPFEVDLLRQDLQMALKLLGQNEIDDAHTLIRDQGFRPVDFEIVWHADPSPVSRVRQRATLL